MPPKRTAAVEPDNAKQPAKRVKEDAALSTKKSGSKSVRRTQCSNAKSSNENSTGPPSPGLRRSERSNKGEGGALMQLHNVGNAIEKRPVVMKRTTSNIPDEQANNPMAPVNSKPKRGRRAKTETITSVLPPVDHVGPTHVVPLGTEPLLPAGQGLAAHGHQFGFRMSSTPSNQSRTPNQGSQTHMQRVQSQTAVPVIDPSLTEPALPPKVHIQQPSSKVRVKQTHTTKEPLAATGMRNPVMDVDPEPAYYESGSEDESDSYDGGRSSGGPSDGGDSSDEMIEEEMAELLEMFGPTGSFYKDSRVSDMLDEDPVDKDGLITLLRHVKNDWVKDHGNQMILDDEETGQQREPSPELVPTGYSYMDLNWRDNSDIAGPGENDQGYDVLKEHHKRNKPPKPPLFNFSGSIQGDVLGIRTTGRDDDSEVTMGEEAINHNGTDKDDISDDEAEPGGVSRAARNSRKPSGSAADPTQLQFYPTNWTEALEGAKNNWRLYLLKTWAFPKRRQHEAGLAECLMSAIAAHEADGGMLERGYYPKYRSDMLTLVWEDTASFRGELKKIAREIVRLLYALFPDPDKSKNFSQARHMQHVAKNVAALLLDGNFLHNGKDDEDRTNNLTNTAIAEVCKTFFYGAENKMGQLFPNEFGSEVPSMAVALVATAIRCALDEWKGGSRKTVSFSAQEYRPVYEEILALVEQVEGDTYHAKKFHSARSDWAAAGRMQNEDDTSVSKTFGMKVSLD